MSYYVPAQRVSSQEDATGGTPPCSCAMSGPTVLTSDLGAYFSPDGSDVQSGYPWDGSLYAHRDLSGLSVKGAVSAGSNVIQGARDAIATGRGAFQSAKGAVQSAKGAVQHGLPSVPGVPEHINPELGGSFAQFANQALQSGVDALWPTIDGAIRRAVPVAIDSAWPKVQAKVQPVQRKVFGAVTAVYAMQALTLLGVGYLAYKAAQR